MRVIFRAWFIFIGFMSMLGGQEAFGSEEIGLIFGIIMWVIALEITEVAKMILDNE